MNDISSRQQESDTKKPVGFFAIPQWLARLPLLTKEEYDAAGIFLGSRDNDENKS